jgi:hypothetical protein
MSNRHSQLPVMVRQADIAIAKPTESNPLKAYLAPCPLAAAESVGHHPGAPREVPESPALSSSPLALTVCPPGSDVPPGLQTRRRRG